ncbi:hypothetical protein AN189_13835 [Loktanella sp. 3ANDIMAR09]|nr:hypothetical protein AN189_13835 [Loktanella sp. 3ANDIMAR09]
MIKPVPGSSGEYQFSRLNNWRIDGEASNIVIEGFAFDGNSDILSVEEMLATGYWDQSAQDGMGGIAINVESGEYITIRENDFHDLYQKAVNIEDGRYVKIQDNILQDVATKSLSGGHGIMRQQGSGDFGDDIDGVYRLEITGNLIFNTYQTMPSWVPSKGYLNMVLDEGKPILIDEVPNFENQDQAVLISDNVIAYGQIDGIRIKPTQGLEVTNNTVYSTGEHGDGITEINTIRSETTDVFPDGVIADNLVFTLAGSQAFELNDLVASS